MRPRNLPSATQIKDKNVGSDLTSLTILLNLMSDVWNDYMDALSSIRSIFLYLDRSYVIQSSTCPSIWDLGLQLYREQFTQVIGGAICEK